MLRYSNSLVPQVVAPGLVVSVSAGRVFMSGFNQAVNIPATMVILQPSTTNYVFLLESSKSVTSNTSGFPNPSYPLAIVVTSASGIVALADYRSDAIA
jgi:hypothetical protein